MGPFGSGTRNQISNMTKSASGIKIAIGRILYGGYLPSYHMKNVMKMADAT